MSEKLIRLSKSCLSDAEKRAVMGVLDREFLGMGAEVQQFEEMLTDFFGRPAICVSTGTAALHLALQAAGIGVGDEVLVQSLTYVASFQAISATGATPVACDVDAETLCLDWRDAEKRLTPKTKAVMPVHYTGGVGALDEIYAFAKKHSLRVIEDAAHAFGTVYQENKVGGFGDMACFSFDGIKNITSGEGGCIVTDDDDILRKVRDARLLGVEKDTQKRFSGKRSWDFDVTVQGWRYHMSNIMAAIGIEQLKRFPEFAKKRKLLAEIYNKTLHNHPRLRPIEHNYIDVVPHIYVVRIDGLKDRYELQNRMFDAGVQIGYHYQPNHLLSLYDEKLCNPLLVTDKVFPQLVSLPFNVDMYNTDIEIVIRYLTDNQSLYM
jgi:dTDP-4-amino-4,6-dideoxygalactose transaminase